MFFRWKYDQEYFQSVSAQSIRYLSLAWKGGGCQSREQLLGQLGGCLTEPWVVTSVRGCCQDCPKCEELSCLTCKYKFQTFERKVKYTKSPSVGRSWEASDHGQWHANQLDKEVLPFGWSLLTWPHCLPF